MNRPLLPSEEARSGAKKVAPGRGYTSSNNRTTRSKKIKAEAQCDDHAGQMKAWGERRGRRPMSDCNQKKGLE